MSLLGILPLLIVLLILVPTLIVRARFTVGQNERLVIFRMGKPAAIHGPGSVMVIPLIESGVKYDVSDDFNARLIDDYLAQGIEFRKGG